MDQEERSLINLLRNYYYDNYTNGRSDECFIIWLEERLVELRAENIDKTNRERPRWLRTKKAA